MDSVVNGKVLTVRVPQEFRRQGPAVAAAYVRGFLDGYRGAEPDESGLSANGQVVYLCGGLDGQKRRRREVA